MKKNAFMVFGLALIMGAGVAVSTHFAIEAKCDYVMAMAEDAQVSSEQSGEATEEEKTRIQKLIEELQAKYNEIKDIQVAGTTIGAIAGALVGAIVSSVPALINRSNIKKALGVVADCQENVSKINEVLVKVQQSFGIVNENYDAVVAKLLETHRELNTVRLELEHAEKNYVGLKEDNESIKKDNQDLREILILMANHTKEYVASGTAEYINSKFKK